MNIIASTSQSTVQLHYDLDALLTVTEDPSEDL